MILPFVYMLANIPQDKQRATSCRCCRSSTLTIRCGFCQDPPSPRGSPLLALTATATSLVLFFDSLVGYTLATFRFAVRGVVFVASFDPDDSHRDAGQP